MKKLVALALVLAMSLCAVSALADGVVRIVSPNSEGLRSVYALFEAKTGIKVVDDPMVTGEAFTKLEEDKELEEGNYDIMYGGSLANFEQHKDLFQDYYAAEDEDLFEAYRNVRGYCTNYTVDGSVILVNTDKLPEGVTVTGYADLLNPALKGMIACADPSSSSSAYCQLTNMLLAMGEGETAAERYESDAAWKFVEDLFVGQEVKITSSSVAHKGVADGEYAVGLTYEDPCAQYVLDGAPVQIVYPVEGTVFLPAQVGILKNAVNVAEAQAFVDFIVSYEAQNYLAENTTSRPIRDTEAANKGMTPLPDLYLIYEDSDYVIAHTAEIKERVKDFILN